MADASKIRVDGISYNIKDTTARDSIDDLNGVAHILKRNTSYTVGDVVYDSELPSWVRLVCTVAGETGSEENDYSSIDFSSGTIS